MENKTLNPFIYVSLGHCGFRSMFFLKWSLSYLFVMNYSVLACDWSPSLQNKAERWFRKLLNLNVRRFPLNQFHEKPHLGRVNLGGSHTASQGWKAGRALLPSSSCCFRDSSFSVNLKINKWINKRVNKEPPPWITLRIICSLTCLSCCLFLCWALWCSTSIILFLCRRYNNLRSRFPLYQDGCIQKQTLTE